MPQTCPKNSQSALISTCSVLRNGRVALLRSFFNEGGCCFYFTGLCNHNNTCKSNTCNGHGRNIFECLVLLTASYLEFQLIAG